MSKAEQPEPMATSNPRRQRLFSSSIAAIERHNGPGDPRAIQLRAELTAERISDWVQRQLAAAPPLTPAQRDRLAALLDPGTGSDRPCRVQDHLCQPRCQPRS